MPRPRPALVLAWLLAAPVASAEEAPETSPKQPVSRPFRIDLPPPPSVPSLVTSILALADAPVPPAPEQTPEAPLDGGDWDDARCETFAADLATRCRADAMEACHTLHAAAGTDGHPCAGRVLVPADLPPAEAVSLRRCLSTHPATCGEAADALDDDGSIAQFRLKTSLFVRACGAGSAAACETLARLVTEEPFRLLDDAIARAPRLRACVVKERDRAACERRHPLRRKPRAPALSPAALALEEAVRAGRFADVKRLARTPALANGTDSEGIPLLFVAIRNGDAPTSLALVKAGAKARTTYDDVPALTAALQHGLVDVAQVLLSKKAPVAPAVPHDALLPLQAAIDAGQLPLAKQLVTAGAVAPRALLLRTVDHADLAALLALLPKKPDPALLAELLARAVLVDETTALALLGVGASPKRVGRPLVRIALDRGDRNLASALVEAGGDGTGDWPLSTAAALGDTTLVRAMLRQGARLDAVDGRTGTTPLASAVQGGHLETLEFLLERGSRTDVTLRDGEPVLFFALRTGQGAVVRLLLASKATADVTWKGLHALHLAAGRRDASLVEALLVAGAPVDPVMEGTAATPLHLAAELGDVATIQRLLEAGADATRKTHDGRTAQAIAMEGGHEAAAAVLAGRSDAGTSGKQPIP